MRYTFKTIKYNQKLILKEGSFISNPGQITIITGQSGTGKSSLFNEIIQSEIASHDTVHISESCQEPCFVNQLTIKEHFSMINDLIDTLDISSYIQLLDVEKLFNLIPPKLSGGEKKKIALLLCVYKDVDTYILDEPTASLNKEYREIITKIFLELKSKNKNIIIFTHDQHLITLADNHYHIENQKLNIVKIANQISIESPSQKSINSDCIIPFLLKIKKNQKGIRKNVSIMIILATLLLALLSDFSQTIYQSQQNYLKKMQNTELVVYKGASPNQVVNGNKVYSFGLEKTLSNSDLDNIASINGIKNIEWRYDSIENVYATFRDDITVYGFDENNLTRPYQININDTIIDINEPITQSTYLESHKDVSNIDIDFGTNGIYISRPLANYIEEILQLTDDDLKNQLVTLTVSVPVYNTFGKFMGVSQNNETMFIDNTTVVYEKITCPLSGILKWSSFGIVNYNNFAVYIERDDLAVLIEKNKRQEDRTIYLIDENWQDYYVNVLPNDLENRVNRVCEDKIWSPTAMSIF